MKLKEELEYYRFECKARAWVILAITIVILVLAFIQSNKITNLAEENELLKSNISGDNLIYSIDTMSNNCGNEFGTIIITKEYGKEDYSIYKQECNSKGYCKYVYIPIEDCL